MAVSKNGKKTDWAKVDALTDAAIRKAVASDPDAPPLLTGDWFRNARLVLPAKRPIAIRLDEDLVEWFKRQGPGYQTRMNAVLRAYVEAHRRGLFNSSAATRAQRS